MKISSPSCIRLLFSKMKPYFGRETFLLYLGTDMLISKRKSSPFPHFPHIVFKRENIQSTHLYLTRTSQQSMYIQCKSFTFYGCQCGTLWSAVRVYPGSAGKNRGYPKPLGILLWFHGSEIIKLQVCVGEEGRCYQARVNGTWDYVISWPVSLSTLWQACQMSQSEEH